MWVERFAWFGFFLLCVTFVIRELAIRQMIPTQAGKVLHSSTRVAAAIAWGVYFFASRRHVRILLIGFVRFCGSGIGWLSIFTGVLFIVAFPFDHLRWSLPGLPGTFIEETLEFQGAVLLLVIAVMVRLNIAECSLTVESSEASAEPRP